MRCLLLASVLCLSCSDPCEEHCERQDKQHNEGHETCLEACYGLFEAPAEDGADAGP